jgi:transcription elongation factor GreA
MRLPTRKSQLLRISDDDGGPIPLTAEAIERAKRDLERLQTTERKQAVEDLTVALAKGDLSENAEYQEAKGRLARIDGRVFNLKERLKRASLIEQGNSDGTVRLGSNVAVHVNGQQKTYDIVGPQESNPSRGRISHISPLGSALIGHVQGDIVTIETPNGPTAYQIIDVR